jgi:hypothetical protein
MRDSIIGLKAGVNFRLVWENVLHIAYYAAALAGALTPQP